LKNSINPKSLPGHRRHLDDVTAHRAGKARNLRALPELVPEL